MGGGISSGLSELFLLPESVFCLTAARRGHIHSPRIKHSIMIYSLCSGNISTANIKRCKNERLNP